MFFPASNFPVLCRFLILVYQRVNNNGQGQGFFPRFSKSGYVLYCFFLCCLIPFESIPNKTGK